METKSRANVIRSGSERVLRPHGLAAELAVATQLALGAGAVLLAHRSRGVEVEYKGPNDPVTAADRDASRLIVDGIAATFPDDGILCEETPDDRTRLDRERVWIVDPMDGTKEFVGGLDDFSVMIGFSIGGRPTLGVVHQPTTGETLWGVVGAGAAIERDGRVGPLDLTRPRAVDTGSGLALAVSRSHRSPLMDDLARVLAIRVEVPCGSVGLKVALVATGRCDGYVDFNRKTKEWDTCAAQAIVEACGGVMTDLFGESLTCNRSDVYNRSGLIAASQEIHRAILSAAAAIALRAFGNG